MTFPADSRYRLSLEPVRKFALRLMRHEEGDAEYFVRINEISASRMPTMNVAGSQRTVW